MKVMVGQHLDGVFASIIHDGEEEQRERDHNVLTLDVTGWTRAAYRVYYKQRGLMKLYILEPELGADARIDATPLCMEGEFRIVQVHTDDDARAHWKSFKSAQP